MARKSSTPLGQPIITSQQCDYGCGQSALYRSVFRTSGEKYCCSPTPNRCPATKQKNSRGVKRALPKRTETYLKRYGVEHPMKLESMKLYGSDNNMNKVDYTAIMLRRHGVDNVAKLPGVGNKISATKLQFSDERKDQISAKRRSTGIKNGRIFLDKSAGEVYKLRVISLSNRTYRKYKSILDPNSLRGHQYHLDHIVSITHGFNHNVPAEILSSIHNLRIIPAKENFRKNSTSEMSIQELYEKYNSTK